MSSFIDLKTFFPYQLSVAARNLSFLSEKIAKQNGLPIAQWRVIAAIHSNQGCNAKDVVNITPMDKGIVSRAVTNLINKQYVKKSHSQTDKRFWHLYLTPKGLKIYLLIAKEIIQLNDSLGLDKNEIEYALKIFKKINILYYN